MKPIIKWSRLPQVSPRDRQEVLIRYRGIINIVVFDAAQKVFHSKDGTIIASEDASISWYGLL